MKIEFKQTLIFSILSQCVFSSNVELNLSHNGPVVLGANITFTAELIDSLNRPASGMFSCEWRDNAHPQHVKTEFTNNSTVYWTISYPEGKYLAKEYKVTLTVYRRFWTFYVEEVKQDVKFNVTATLNGKIEMQENESKFVPINRPVKHIIKLSEADNSYITDRATSVLTFWFVNCQYYGFSADSSFTFNFTEEKPYTVEALVVASFDELIAKTATTSATLASSSSISPTSIIPSSSLQLNSSTIDSSPPPFTENPSSRVTTPSVGDTTSIYLSSTSSGKAQSTTNAPHHLNENIISTLNKIYSDEIGLDWGRNTEENENIISITTENMVLLNNISLFSCFNSTIIPQDPNKTYGYFTMQIIAKAPISNVSVKGNNWLNFGDVLNLNVSCNGSGKFLHCTQIKIGVYNVTGEETCSSPLEEDDCGFTISHYFRETNTYTYVFIITNDVSKVVNFSVIRMYKVTVQPQLSVIVVPVTCSLLAIIIIVFGVSYYVQSRNRYTVEVADFDFGQANETEYKTFYERLIEDLSNMFNRSSEFHDQTDVVPRRSKYDNMEES